MWEVEGVISCRFVQAHEFCVGNKRRGQPRHESVCWRLIRREMGESIRLWCFTIGLGHLLMATSKLHCRLQEISLGHCELEKILRRMGDGMNVRSKRGEGMGIWVTQ